VAVQLHSLYTTSRRADGQLYLYFDLDFDCMQTPHRLHADGLYKGARQHLVSLLSV
jgi:hypothetical protein